MEKREIIERVAVFAFLALLAGWLVNDFLIKPRMHRKERVTRKMHVNELWQQYLEKDPNEEELWIIVKERKSYDLMELACNALLEVTKSEERLLYLLKEYKYDKELRIKISDRLLENPSIKALKKIINIVPERAENALLVLLRTTKLNDIGFECLVDTIRNVPSHRKLAWDAILFKPEKIKTSLCYSFLQDPNYPKEAVDIYFALDLKPEHYKELIFYVQPLDDRALEEFLATKPENEDVREIITGNRRDRNAKKEVKVKVAKYILANSPSERELDRIRKECPSLRKKVREAKKKILERKIAEQKMVPKTKEDIIRAIERISD